ncbi:MAG: hypothetical protein JWM87_773 [Candidatus Eremiobacteraeota bacterium]|nr:hypothetical protein [Candidatus Eremiobacteraeota bacterium]
MRFQLTIELRDGMTGGSVARAIRGVAAILKAYRANVALSPLTTSGAGGLIESALTVRDLQGRVIGSWSVTEDES